MELDLQELARKGLQAELARLDAERARIATLLAELGGTSRSATVPVAPPPARRTRTMSPEGRQRIQDAVRRRWERVRAKQPSKTAGVSADAAPQEATTSTDDSAISIRRRGRTTKRAAGRKK